MLKLNQLNGKNEDEKEEFGEEVVPVESKIQDLKKVMKKYKILDLTKKACDRNDDALKRLSKN